MQAKNYIICIANLVVISVREYTCSNPCFSNRTSEVCLDHIALQRSTTKTSAAKLRDLALSLYENEENSPSAVFDVLTVAVACLASGGTLKPGPDSDCAACGPSCTQESRREVCELYCVPSVVTTTKHLKSSRFEYPANWFKQNLDLDSTLKMTLVEESEGMMTGLWISSTYLLWILVAVVTMLLIIILVIIWLLLLLLKRKLKKPGEILAPNIILSPRDIDQGILYFSCKI